jgi:DNA topoisomerase-1
VKGEKKPVVAHFYGEGSKKLEIKNEAQVSEIADAVGKASFTVDSVKKGERVKKRPLPFTTSTLQQEASKTLNFSTQKTMRLAQQLYEGIDVKGQGTVGVITYLRTDSTRVADEAQVMAADYITRTYGEEFLAKAEKKNDDKKRIQDAHEAIRPTDISLTPAALKDSLSRDQFRLYQLIWKRFTAS